MPTTVINLRLHPVPPFVVVDRSSPFGNPFRIGFDGDREAVLLKYVEWFYAPERKALREKVRKELTGKTLACWCTPLRCHAEILAAYCDARTVNTCPECGRREEDPDPVAGIIHRTRICEECYPKVVQEMESWD
jgi:hypothetical protein